MLKGRIHSIETSGCFDGPGIRTVVFFQGCPLRCIYCHNPDTWDRNKGEEYSVAELMVKIRKYKNYYRASGGGVTFSGGEPLLQAEFLLEMLKACKEEGINTAVDTSGILLNDRDLLREILAMADYVILDIKGVDPGQYKMLTGRNKYDLPEFIDLLNSLNKKVWLRYVAVPGINDSEEEIRDLKKIIKTVNNAVKIEVLAFHQMGSFKYEELGIEYKLEGHPEMEFKRAKQIEKQLSEA